MSQNTFPQIQFSVRGLEQVILVGNELPDIPLESIPILVGQLRDIGVDAAKATLETTSTSEKATGKTAELMVGIIESIKFPEDWEINIGPETRGMGENEEYSKFVNMSTGPFVENRAVQILPYPLRWGYQGLGRWQFIGIRPRIEGHPWMEGAAEAILGQTGKLYGAEVYRLTGELDRKKNMIEFKGEMRG